MPKAIRFGLIFLIFSFFSFLIWIGTLLKHYTVPILMYHYVNNEEPLKSRLGVSPESFERQMRFLRERKYNIVSLEELTDLIKNKKRIPPMTAAVTFDDGYLDNYTHAYPVLKKYNIPAAIFVVINRIGKHL